jgi:small-conductance mechanosensitive channel
MGHLTTLALFVAILPTEVDPLPDELADADVVLLRTAAFVIGFAIVVALGWGVLEPAISRVVRVRNRHNQTLREAITRYVRLTVVVVGVAVGLSVAGFANLVGNSALVVAAGTLALGIAGQDVIGSLVSGTALVVDPEFNVGNYIRWDGGEGEVTSITLRVTRVRTLDGALVTIPNTTLTDEAIERPFEGGTGRFVQYVEIAYEDDVEAATDLLASIVADVDGVVTDPEPRVGVEDLGDDAVRLAVEYWIDDPALNRFPVRSAVARTVLNRFDRAGFELSPAAQRSLEGQLRIDDGAGASVR